VKVMRSYFDLTEEEAEAENRDFIAWLKENEMYNPMASHMVMLYSHRVWRLMREKVRELETDIEDMHMDAAGEDI
jgi:hypothetical protein